MTNSHFGKRAPLAKFSISVETFDTSTFYTDMVNSAVQQVLGRPGYSENALQKQVREAVAVLVRERIDAAIAAEVEALVSKPIQKFDTFGNPVGAPVSVEEIVRLGAQQFLTEPVDRDGKPVRDSYTTKDSRIGWMVKKIVVQGLAKDIEEHAKAARAEVTKRAQQAAAAVIAGVKA